MLTVETMKAPATRMPAPPACEAHLDPFGIDRPDDAVVVTSERRLRRLAISAADAGARFVREALPHDPAAWMLTPLPMFELERPLDACQELDGFRRASLLNGLHIGLDATAAELDALVGDDELSEDFEITRTEWSEAGAPRLFTASVEGDLGWGAQRLQAFCAMVVPTAEVMRRRLETRYGCRLAEDAEIRSGFSADDPLAGLLSADTRRLLSIVASDPRCDLADGLEVQAERRCAA